MVNSESAALRELTASFQQRVNQALERALPRADIHPTRLHQAMRYAVLDGGKRFRPTLAYATAQALGGDLAKVDAAACAVELIHAYSLVHDDLPAMDNDDLRRGKPTCHRAFDEATAILAGDALQAFAFQILVQGTGDLPVAVRLRMVEMLATAAGSRGMAGGQAIDLQSVGRELSIAELEDMHIHKTGALIRTSVMLGALSVDGSSEMALTSLDRYAKNVGLAFQVWDDVLDVEGTTETLGKPQGSDRARNKPTYPAAMGLAAAKERARELRDNALQSIVDLGPRADPLRWLANYVVARTN